MVGVVGGDGWMRSCKVREVERRDGVGGERDVEGGVGVVWNGWR